MDDGKANAVSLALLDGLEAALRQAIEDDVVLLLEGRAGMFSAGFHMPTLTAKGPDALSMLTRGFELVEKLLAYPKPMVTANTGHAIAMGCFLLLAGDHRVGAAGPFKIVANEVAIGLTMPRTAVEICRLRLTAPAFQRSMLISAPFTPETALAAGHVHELVAPEQVCKAALTTAKQLTALNMPAFRGTKQRVNGDALRAVRAAVEADSAEFAALFGPASP
ncbi:MAG: crotonase/enoyl-CoA hydratase family protein [Polyangiales bacterium]